MMHLPDWKPITREIILDRRAREYSQAALFPPVEKLPDGGLVVNEWNAAPVHVWETKPSPWGEEGLRVRTFYPEKTHAVVWDRADHPNLSALPANAPRAVNALYRADGQLAYLRGDYDLVERAGAAWDRYQEALAA